MQFDDLFERMTLHYTSGDYAGEVNLAKQIFFDDAGIMDEASPHFEMRMTQFIEWFLFTRPLQAKGVPPVQHALASGEFKFDEDERPLVEALANTRHSLFEFLKIRGDDVYIKDLFSAKKLVIKGSAIRVGFSREEFFDTRLIPSADTFIFAKAFCIHPAEATKFILNEVKKLKKSEPVLQEALMLRLMKMRYKYEQYRHLKLDHVYTNEKKVRF
jgi:hypothetical protein